jgi:hypothetical protein
VVNEFDGWRGAKPLCGHLGLERGCLCRNGRQGEADGKR